MICPEIEFIWSMYQLKYSTTTIKILAVQNYLLVVLAPILERIYENLHSKLYLDDPPMGFKFFLILIAIIVTGLLWFGLLKKRSDGIHMKEYLKQQPKLEVVDNANIALNKGLLRAVLTIIFIIIFLIGSVYVFNQFLNDSNLMTYALATLSLNLLSVTIAILKSAVFILKLAIDNA